MLGTLCSIQHVIVGTGLKLMVDMCSKTADKMVNKKPRNVL